MSGREGINQLCDIDGQPKASEGFERVNAPEKKWVDSTREKLGNPSDLQLLLKSFDRMK